MTVIPWIDKPKIDELSLTDVFMRRVPSSSTKNQETLLSDVQTFLQGSAQVLVAKESDLPPTVNGVHTLDQTKNYTFNESFSLSDPLGVPAGYLGWIKSTFLSEGTVDYLGTDPFISTLNIAGSIVSIADNGSGGITVTTSATHELLNGQFINITGTFIETSYIKQRLQISNASGVVFDVQIPFTATDIGFFNTGFDILQITDIDFTNFFSANLFDLTSSESLVSVFTCRDMSELGYLSPGIVRKTGNAGFDNSVLAYFTDGIIFENCLTVSNPRSLFLSLDPSNTTSKGITIRGGINPVKGIIDGSSFETTNILQRPIRIESDIHVDSNITIQTSVDNLVSDEYFDTSSGGLDEFDRKVIAINNGKRKNSMFIGGWFHNTNTALTSILDGTFSPLNLSTAGGVTPYTEIERFDVTVLTDGTIQYNGAAPKTITLNSVLSLMKTGSTANYNLRYAISRSMGAFDVLPTPIERLQSISQTNRDTNLIQEVVMDPTDRIRIEAEGVGTTDSISVVFGSLNAKG